MCAPTRTVHEILYTTAVVGLPGQMSQDVSTVQLVKVATPCAHPKKAPPNGFHLDVVLDDTDNICEKLGYPDLTHDPLQLLGQTSDLSGDSPPLLPSFPLRPKGSHFVPPRLLLRDRRARSASASSRTRRPGSLTNSSRPTARATTPTRCGLTEVPSAIFRRASARSGGNVIVVVLDIWAPEGCNKKILRFRSCRSFYTGGSDQLSG